MAKILMVDNDREFLDACQTVLESKGHIVETAQNVTDGEKLAHDVTLDVIFMDIMMEAADDGIALLHKLRKAGLTLPIVMLSGVGKVTGYEYGNCDEVMPCSDFLEKPVMPDDLLAKVESVLTKE